MNIKKENVCDVGSCNFCNRGVLNDTKTNLVYPYSKIFVLKNETISIKICHFCLQKIQNYKKGIIQ